MLSPEGSSGTRTGLTQVITGDGKGKTTAAVGTVIRASGHNLKVYISFFMKAGRDSGEFTVLSKFPNVTLSRFGTPGPTDPKNIKPEQREQAKLALIAAKKALLSGKYDLVVLDEINVASHFKLIEVEDVLELIRQKPANVELILTGRYANSRIIEAADLVTECREIKHPWNKGITARKGIEY